MSLRRHGPADLNDRVVLVTGASSGIGAATALRLGRAGAKVGLVARRRDRLEAVASELGTERALVLDGDISEAAFCAKAVAEVAGHFGRLDAVVNNAGVSMNALFADSGLDVYRQMMDVNYFGSLYMAHAALPLLEATEGSIVFVSSIVGHRGFPTRSGYSASKFAVQGLFESLRVELAPKGVHVGIVCPGYTETEIRSQALGPDGEPRLEAGVTKGDVMPADAAAAHIVDVLVHRRRSVVLTKGGTAMVWLNKLAPRLADKLVVRFVG